MVIFVSGLSGSGKTAAASASGVDTILPLDSFFFQDRPQLPKWLGRTDWETILSFDLDAAVAATIALAEGKNVAVPIYDHRRDAASGLATIVPAGPVVAEGVYAPAVYERVVDAGIDAALLLLDTPAVRTFGARIRRDVAERKMNPLWALIRSTRLLLRNGHYRRDALERGAELVGPATAAARIAQLAESL